MENISIKEHLNYDIENKEINENEFFSLKIIDSLYKKDIGKFLEILSTNFIQKAKFIMIFKLRQYRI